MKYNRLKKLAALFAISSVLVVSCQNDDIINTEKSNNSNYAISDTSNVGNVIINIHQNSNISKGYRIDHNDFIETGEAFFGEKPEKKFKTMKVYRQSDSTKYFYIMLTNLDVPYPFDDYLKDTTKVSNSLCSPYANDYTYLKEYGLLYNKYSAEQIRNYIFMKVPFIKNGVPLVKNGKTVMKSIKGRFMNTTDLADLLECEYDSIFKEGLHGISDYIDSDELFDTKFAYYNAFVFGINETYSIEGANHSLGGHRDIFNVDYAADRDSIRVHTYANVDDYILKQIYTKDCCEMNHSGFYWMASEKNYPRLLRVYRNMGWSENEDWVAMWMQANYNSAYGYDGFQNSVRLIFDPFNN